MAQLFVYTLFIVQEHFIVLVLPSSYLTVYEVSIYLSSNFGKEDSVLLFFGEKKPPYISGTIPVTWIHTYNLVGKLPINHTFLELEAQ